MSVEYICHSGDDALVVNAARVSFEKEISGELSKKDVGLLDYLAREGHWTPYAHPHITLRIEAPIFVARQLAKSVVGLCWSEVSRRYVDTPLRYSQFDAFRSRAEKIKQGSGDAIAGDEQATLQNIYREAIESSDAAYLDLLELGVCPEQARAVLPLASMTTWIWTGSLMAFARVCALRLDSHAQYETRAIAEKIAEIMAGLYPHSWAALTRNRMK